MTKTKYVYPFLSVIGGTTFGWWLNKQSRNNEITIHGITNKHDALVVRQVHIYENPKDNENTSNIKSEKELLNFVEQFHIINKKYKGFCETSVFKNSTFSNTTEENEKQKQRKEGINENPNLYMDQNLRQIQNEKGFMSYLIVDKWKTQNEFEKAKEEFQKTILQKQDEHSEKLKNLYLNYEMYTNNYETISSTSVFQKMWHLFFN